MSSPQTELLQAQPLSPEFYSKLPSVTSPRICSKIKKTEKLLNETIFHQEIMKDTEKASFTLNEAQSNIENLFDELKNHKLDITQVNILTTLCRKLNEDPALQNIREHQFNITNSPQNKQESTQINPLPISKLSQPSPSGRHSTQSSNRSISAKRLSWSSPSPKITKDHVETKSLENLDEALLTDESQETPTSHNHTQRARISLLGKRMSPLKPISSVSNIEVTQDEDHLDASNLQFETSNPKILFESQNLPSSSDNIDKERIIEVNQEPNVEITPILPTPEVPLAQKPEQQEVNQSSSKRPEIEIDLRKNAYKYQEEFDEQIARLNFLYNNHKIDQAYKTLKSLKEFVKKENTYSQEESLYFETKFRENYTVMNDIEMLYPFVAQVINELEDEKGYKLETSKKNLIIKYKDSSQGKTSLKMETIVNAPLANLLSLFYEADGYSSWTPFCKESKEIKKTSRAGNAMWLKWNLPPPITNREGYLIGMGYDRFEENGSFLLLSQTINENKKLQERFDIKVPEKSKLVRLEIHYVGVQLTPLTKDKTHMKIVNMFDMKLKMVPSSVMNWVVKKGASFLVDKIVGKASELNGPFWQQKRLENRDFYDWLKGLVDGHLAANPHLGGQ